MNFLQERADWNGVNLSIVPRAEVTLTSAFVTGGTGFVGINLVRELIAQRWEVSCLHRPTSNLKHLGREPVALKVGDLADKESLERAIPPDVDVVFHVAADTGATARCAAAQVATNVYGTRNVVGAACRRRARRLVLTSTASAYGKQEGPLSEESRSTAAGSWITYERSKWLAEQEARKGMQEGLEVVILNPCSIFGPYDTSVWGKVFPIIKAGRLKALPPGSVPVNHVHEVARAHIAAAERGRSGENYILNGECAPFARIFRGMARLMDVQLNAPVLSPSLFMAAARISSWIGALTGKEADITPEMAAILVRNNIVITDKAERELGYRRTPLAQCLADSYAWICAEGLL